MDDRRGQPRAQLGSPAVAFVADQRVECRAIDISTAGISLLTPVVRDLGQFLRVNFSLAPPGGVPRWYDADGIVVRVARVAATAPGGVSGVVLGVQFVVVDDRVARDVHEYVQTARRAAPQPAAAPRAANRSVMPDALHPPPRTGEFHPAEPDSHDAAPARKRRTAEYGVSDLESVPRAQAVPASPRRPTPTPRTSVAAPVAPRSAPSPEEGSKLDLERLFRDALSEVDGQRAGGRKDRRK